MNKRCAILLLLGVTAVIIAAGWLAWFVTRPPPAAPGRPVLSTLPRGQNVPSGSVIYEPGSPAAVRFTRNLFGEAAAWVEVLHISSGYNPEHEDPMIRFCLVARVKEGDGAAFAEKLRPIWSAKDYFAWNKDDFIHPFSDLDSGSQQRGSAIETDVGSRVSIGTVLGLADQHAPRLRQAKLTRMLRGDRSDECALHFAQGVPEVILLHYSIPRSTADWKYPGLRAADGSIPPHAVRKK